MSTFIEIDHALRLFEGSASSSEQLLKFSEPRTDSYNGDLEGRHPTGGLGRLSLKGKYALSDLSSCPTRPHHHAREPTPAGAPFVFAL